MIDCFFFLSSSKDVSKTCDRQVGLFLTASLGHLLQVADALTNAARSTAQSVVLSFLSGVSSCW